MINLFKKLWSFLNTPIFEFQYKNGTSNIEVKISLGFVLLMVLVILLFVL